MSVITLDQLKVRLGISSSDTSEDAALSALIPQVQGIAERHVGYALEYAVRTEVYPGTLREWISLAGKPCYWYTPTGNLAKGSAVVSAVSDTTGIQPGMPVAGVGLPSGATVLSVDSAVQITLSQAATD